MHQHHKDSLDHLIEYFSNREEIIALVFGGSVAKGKERPDSDLDAMVVVTEDFYREKSKNGQLVETIAGYCTYEGGYFDIKYYTKDVLEDASEKGSEPARNAYLNAKVLFSKDPEIEQIVSRIPVFQQSEKEEKFQVFYSSLMLNQYYFWGLREESLYLKLRTATEIVYTCYRIILLQNETLFPCNRNLERAVQEAADKPEAIIVLANSFLTKLDDETLDAFTKAVTGWMEFVPANDFNKHLTKYQEYYELWWSELKPMVNEW